jgi:predicted AAA+ superfamily ATPase
MHRLILEKFIEWKNQSRRKPLIVRGAPQVGKTWTIKYFGNDYFEGSLYTVDLEKRPDWHRIFDENLIPTRIISELEILLNTKIIPGKDLLFFDEVQSYPRSIMALRYLYEEMP